MVPSHHCSAPRDAILPRQRITNELVARKALCPATPSRDKLTLVGCIIVVRMSNSSPTVSPHSTSRWPGPEVAETGTTNQMSLDIEGAVGADPGLWRRAVPSPLAQEGSWCEDNRRVPNGDQVHRVAGLAMMRKPSVDFSGYWQRHKAA